MNGWQTMFPGGSTIQQLMEQQERWRQTIVGGAGVTAEQFDRLNAAIDPDANPPDGLIFHASGPVDGGWGVLDFWESRAHYDRFVQERIGPAMASAGVDGPPPETHEFPVYEHFPR